MWCIYCIMNKTTGKTYVGQHKYKDSSNMLGNYYGSGLCIKRAVSKYGRNNFRRKILQYGISTKRAADISERVWIKVFREYGLAEYNIANGGQGGSEKGRAVWNKGVTGYKFHMTEELHNKLSEAAKERYRKHKSPKFGSGRPKVQLLCKETGRVYIGYKAAAEGEGVSRSSVCKSLRTGEPASNKTFKRL